MSVHYKFKSALDYDTVTFDGLHISVGDLKAAISQQKRIGKTSDFDLEITNAQTKEIYVDDNALIPKNTSLLVARVPLSQQPKKQWEGSNSNSAPHKDVTVNKGLADLSRMEGSEQDKINAMISQSTFDYDPSNYQKIRGQNQRGAVPSNYICYKCQKRGHWIKDCPAANSGEPVEIRRSTGIPRSFMVPVEGPKAPGAMMTPSGTFAVPAVDHEAYMASENCAGDPSGSAPSAPEPTIPDELICSLCRDLLTDAVMIPCCGNSFCDECIRGALLESEDHECPDCREKEISPTTLIPNRFLRNSVSSFRNQTGYSRRAPHRPSVTPAQARAPIKEATTASSVQQPPPNGPVKPQVTASVESRGGEESDGSADDNITVTMPPKLAHHAPHRHYRYGHQPMIKPVVENPNSSIPLNLPRIEEQRASTPTIDERREPMERRDPMSSQIPYNRGPHPFAHGASQPPQRFNDPPRFGPPPGPGFVERFPPEPYQPPPPGIKESPSNRPGEDPLEAFNRMIREKEMRAKRREEERRRELSPSRSRSRSRTRTRTRSRTPRVRARSRASSRPRSRSMSRGRLRRSPWSPRRRRTRSRSLSLTRSPSPRRRMRSPIRYRSPPLRSPPRSPLRSPIRSPLRSPVRSPRRTPRRSPPPPRSSPHRYAGVYDELMSPPRRSVEPPYGARYGPRNSIPPPSYPPIGVKTIAPMGGIPIQADQPPGYRGRYDMPPFEDIPPGLEPPVPGFEPSPFEKPSFGPPVGLDRERLPHPNYRDSYRPPAYVEGPPPFRDIPIAVGPTEIPVHVGEQSRYRDNFRPGPYRDQGSVPFRDGPPYRESGSQPPPFRDPNYRGAAPFRDNSYRSAPYRDNTFRDNPPHNNFRDGVPPFRQSSPESNVHHESNFRDAYRDDNIVPNRPGYRSNVRSRIGPRRDPNIEHERHRDREGRERDRYADNRDPPERNDRIRNSDRRPGYDKSRETRDDRREIERNRESERARDHEKTPDKKTRTSPKHRDSRDKKRSESRGRSRDRERDRREKKEDRTRDKTSADRSKDHKEKEKKLKERKKKKREKEKEKDIEKKKKRDKKEKKDKDVKKEDEDPEKSDVKDAIEKQNEVSNLLRIEKPVEIKEENKNVEETIPTTNSPKTEQKDKVVFDDLYGDEVVGAVDKEIIQTYVKNDVNESVPETNNSDIVTKEEPFDGIELQANADELDLKLEESNGQNSKEMLAPLPELSKWEVDDESADKKEGEVMSPKEKADGTKVTSDVIKRAENAIFAKAIHSLKPIEIKKISGDRVKLYDDEAPKSTMNNIQITVPVTEMDHRSIEVNEKKKAHSKTPPPRLSVKERLGGKVDEIRRNREARVIHSTVERVKSRSKTPKRETQHYRRVTVEKDRNRKGDALRPVSGKGDRRVFSENVKVEKQHFTSNEKRENIEKGVESRDRQEKKSDPKVSHHERKKSTLDEAHFEPDYDETVESETETKEEPPKKRDYMSLSDKLSDKMNINYENKKSKLDVESLNLVNLKRKPEPETDSSSDSDDSSSSSSSEERKRKKKKKRAKKKKKRAASDSDSDSDSSSDDHKKKKKKRKHKKKSSKKKKKSKHK
ncbi:E3 ubiquitin-protein ligase RBBP6-like isoform X3 [Bombyx mandarina]|uniref:E3 ubiquitin-protein ligase RBBP6-like isoform X3 n=1 Tax=Bombyx mandarina TaxID=7092 RepID=A0A6J2JDJ5_BOMMA|nr:E3 ubiquitin-protein ligase RBBP6-like isoform X3 [Bombyx mandarina]